MQSCVFAPKTEVQTSSLHRPHQSSLGDQSAAWTQHKVLITRLAMNAGNDIPQEYSLSELDEPMITFQVGFQIRLVANVPQTHCTCFYKIHALYPYPSSRWRAATSTWSIRRFKEDKSMISRYDSAPNVLGKMQDSHCIDGGILINCFHSTSKMFGSRTATTSGLGFTAGVVSQYILTAGRALTQAFERSSAKNTLMRRFNSQCT